MARWIGELRNEAPTVELREREMLKQHTSFRIGGEAEAMLFPKTTEELAACLKVTGRHGVPVRILGGGTNILAPDGGVDGAVICLKDALTGIRRIDDTGVEAYAGETLARVAVFARDEALSGLAFAHGIPGTVGGGIYMNAGAYGGEMAQAVESVTVMEPDGTLRERRCSRECFGYRRSVFQQEGIIVRAVFRLATGSREEIADEMHRLREKRAASQPLELPSAGSAFKRPQSGYAAALIDEAGLKGYRVGDAAISEKHAGFAVNLGNATAAEVVRLLDDVRRIVLDRSGIELEPEIRIWE